MFLQAQGAILSGVGYSEKGYRVRMEGARLGGEDTCPPDRVPLWTTLVSNVSIVSVVSDVSVVSVVSIVSVVSVVSVLKKAYPCKGRGYA